MDISSQTTVRPTQIPRVALEDIGSAIVRRIPLLDGEPWGESWQSTVLALKAERVRRERGLPLPPCPSVLTDAQENACRAAYGAIYARQKWTNTCEVIRERNKGKARDDREEIPEPPGWVHDRLRSSLLAWNATFGGDDGIPPPDPNEWNPKTYAGQSEVFSEPDYDPDGWGTV